MPNPKTTHPAPAAALRLEQLSQRDNIGAEILKMILDGDLKVLKLELGSPNESSVTGTEIEATDMTSTAGSGAASTMPLTKKGGADGTNAGKSAQKGNQQSSIPKPTHTHGQNSQLGAAGSRKPSPAEQTESSNAGQTKRDKQASYKQPTRASKERCSSNK